VVQRLADFDLSSGSAAGTPTNCTHGIIDCGGGWYRCYMTWTDPGGRAVLPYVYVCDAVGSYSFAGASQDSIRAFGVQLELGVYPSSHIHTTTAPVARVADTCYYNATNLFGANQGAVRFRFLGTGGVQAGANRAFVTLADASATNVFLAYIAASTGILTCYHKPDSANLSVAGASILDRVIHEAMVTWIGDRLDLWIDGECATATMTTAPTGITRLWLGCYPGPTWQANDFIPGDVKTFNTYQPSWVCRGSGFLVTP